MDKLDAQTSIGTVAFIEDDDESMRHPVTMPAAFVVLDKGTSGKGKAKGTVLSPLTWAIVVRSQKLLGPSGCLPVVDLVLDELTGFNPGSDVKPLSYGGIDLYDKKYESVAYIVRFTTEAVGKSKYSPC